MAQLIYYVLDAVTEICNRMNDSNFDTWAEDTLYTGRALDVFYEALNELIEVYAVNEVNKSIGLPIKEIPYLERDFHGIIKRFEITITSTAVYDLYTNINNLNKVLLIYPDPDGTDNMPKVIKRVTEDYFNQTAGYDFVDTVEVYWYANGDDAIFYPKTTFASGTHKLQVKYIEYVDLSRTGASKDTNLLTYFTAYLVNEAIKITVAKLVEEEQRKA